MSNKDRAISFLAMVAAKKVKEAYDLCIAPNFVHHNQYCKEDRQSLMAAMEEGANRNPNKVLEVKQAFEDGNTVITHSHIKQNANDIGAAVVHIFRFEKGQVVELWDIWQQIAEDSPNENGAF
jgi:predicted SnoaL-like aldol condensation-catalyzing enzyme